MGRQRFDPRQFARLPIVAAPMGGGPTTPELVVAVAQAGALGFLAAGYKTVEAVEADIKQVRAATDAPFGVNVFVPQPRADAAVVERYVQTLADDAARLDAPLGDAAWDDDGFDDKIAALLADAPALVTFTFGCPDREVVAALQAAGTCVGVTVTSPDEANVAADAAADVLCVQGIEAGGHQGWFLNGDSPRQGFGLLSLLSEIPRVCDIPMVAAGGIATATAVAAVLAGGAAAAQAGTAFLLCPEAGTSATYRAALSSGDYTTTALTRAFSGRWARGLLNSFMIDHPDAPAAYPEINNSTRPLRAAAAAAGDPDRMSLWAGQGFRSVKHRPAGEVVELLGEGAS